MKSGACVIAACVPTPISAMILGQTFASATRRWLVFVGLIGSLLFQDPVQAERVQMAELLRRVRERKRSVEERGPAMQGLLAMAMPEAAQKLAEALGQEADLLAGENERAERQLTRSVERAAQAVAKERMTRATQEQVTTLRKELLEFSRGDGLSEAIIRAECDARLSKLEGLLRVTLNQVWDRQESLFEDLDRLLLRLEEEAKLYGWRVKAEEKRAAPLPAPPALDEDGLYRQLERIVWLATPMPARDQARWLSNEQLAPRVDPEEYLGVVRLNEILVFYGLAVQVLDPKLCEASRGHSKDMLEQGFFSHDSPLPGRETPWARAALAGTSASAENIAWGCATGADAIAMWWYSPGHHKNMLGGAARVGLGRWESHWTQLFGD